MRLIDVGLLLAMVITGTVTLNGQSLKGNTGAGFGLPGVYHSRHNDAFAFLQNPASLAATSNTSIGVSGERKYMVEGLGDYLVATSIPTSSGGFGIQAQYSGSIQYNQSKLGLGYGHRLGHKLHAGLGFNFHPVSIQRYGKTKVYSVDAGMVTHITPKVHAALAFSLPVLSPGTSPVFSFGTGYEISEEVTVSANLVKHQSRPLTFDGVITYNVVPPLTLRTGVSTAQPCWWLSAGLKRSLVRIDIIGQYHLRLGLTPGVAIIYFPIKKSVKSTL